MLGHLPRGLRELLDIELGRGVKPSVVERFDVVCHADHVDRLEVRPGVQCQFGGDEPGQILTRRPVAHDLDDPRSFEVDEPRPAALVHTNRDHRWVGRHAFPPSRTVLH